MSLNTTARTWVAGEKPPASTWNTEIRDAINGIQAAWTSYTPTWTATGTNPVLNNGTIAGNYMQVGKTIHFRISLTFGSTTTVGSGAYIFGLPVTAIGTTAVLAVGVMVHSGSRNTRLGYLTTTTGLVLTDMSGANVTNAVPFAWASGDTIGIQGSYEAA
jgi:hypothetical protein